MAPRVPRTPRHAPKPPPIGPGTPRPAVAHDNLHGEEEERVQLISFIAKATQTGTARDAAKVPFDAATKAHNQVFSLAKAANPTFTRKYLEKKMEEMNRSPEENARAKTMEARHDRWLGILTPEQQKMHLEPGTPQEAKDEVDWEARGYSVGLRGLEPKLPEGIPPRMDQPFMKGHGIGYEQYQAALKVNVPGARRLREEAAADFAKDNPDVDLDAAAKKLAKDPKFMARGAPEGESPGSTATASSEPASEQPPTSTSDASTATSGGASQSGPDEGFEATAEELAAQPGRQAIKDRREGNTSGVEVV